MNRLTVHTVPKSAGVDLTTHFGYWPSGKFFWVRDPNEQTTYLGYNESDQLNLILYPGLTESQSWAYDDAHNLQSRTTVNGEIQSFTYDIRNRRISMSWSNNLDSATYGYDDVGRLTSSANPNSTVTRQYDDTGRLTLDQQNVTGLGILSVNYEYNEDGTVKRTYATPVLTPAYDYSFGYDTMGRFETITPTGGNVAFQYYYDAASNEIQRHNYLSNPQLDQFYYRDELNRMWRLEMKKGATLLGSEDYTYDAMSRLGSVRREDNLQDQFSYYRDGELNLVSYGISPTPSPSPTSTPRPTPTPRPGSPTPTSTPGGTPTPTPPGQIATPTFSPDGTYYSACAFNYTFNVIIRSATTNALIRYTTDGSTPTATHGTQLANGGTASFTVQSLHTTTLKAIAYVGASGSTVESADYSFERDCGQGPGGPENLQTVSRAVTYLYDAAGNRTTVLDNVNGNTTYTPNSLNQYTSVTGSAITNGPNHEVSSFKGPNDPQQSYYYYVNDEHLKQVTSGSNNYYLYYDALGRCVKRTLNGATTYYIYDGEKPILEYNQSGQITRNVYGKGIDEILMRTDPSVNGGVAFYYLQDHEGSVTHLTNVSGNAIEKYRYDVFGGPFVYDGNGNPRPGGTAYKNRFLFTGREQNATFGFYEYRARAYHPGLGRFMSEDPKLFDAGDYNLFRYCHNDPLDLTDPMGLESPAWAQAIIPGQIEWDNAVANFHAGNYGTAAGWAVTMVAQQFLAVGTLGTSTRVQQSLQAARTAMAERQVAAVIGKYPNYLKVADQIGAKRFNIPTSVWNKMSEAQRWTANQKFLDRAIARGGDIMLDKSIKDISGVSGELRKELNYLSQKGYQLSGDGSRMVRSPQFEAAIQKGTQEAQEHSSNLIHSKPDPNSP